MPAEQAYYDEFLHVLFTTAMEGGIGYWCEAQSYHHWLDSPACTKEDLQGFYADIIDVESEDQPQYRIDRAVVDRGFRLAVEMEEAIQWSSGWLPPSPLSMMNTPGGNDWDFDAGDADMIVQLGLFGEVVFG